MHRFAGHIVELAAGGLILGLGLLYLTVRDNSAGRLTDNIKEYIIEKQDLHEQSYDINTDAVTDEELYAIVMGCRDLPISIDGSIIPPDGTDYSVYFLLIRSGNYHKSYLYDSNHNIMQIIYTYSGSL